MLFNTILFGQKNELKELEYLVQNGRYVEALQHANGFESTKKEYFFYRGWSQFEMRNIKDALSDFSYAYNNGYDKSEIIYLLARSHHLMEQFREAAQAYKLYLTKLKKDDPQRETIKLYIKQCGYGINAIYYDQPGFVENLGNVVNSAYDDYGPVFSPNYEKKIYYSSNKSESTGGLRNEMGLSDEKNGFYSSDIYAAEMIDGKWRNSPGIPPFINSAAHEEIQDFCSSGNVLVFKRTGNGDKSQFLADTFSTVLKNETYPISTPALSSHGDRDMFFVNDSTIIFSSKRSGGYGGYDLYITEQIDEDWSQPVNLGPMINSIYDERTPFLTENGTILYFSSNREKSLGGFDVFHSKYGMERSQWSMADNVGHPISSPGDDLHFRLERNGRSGLFSSDRMNTNGGSDLYIVYLKEQVLEQIVGSGFVPFLHYDISDSKPREKSIDQEVSESLLTEKPPEIKTREIIISSLYYSESTKLLEGNNRVEINNLLDIMLIYPETKVILSGFTSAEGNKAYELYFSIKRAEIVSDYLIKNGIEGSRISLFGYGAQYPMVLDKKSSLAVKNSQRIDIQIFNNNPSLIVSYNNPKVIDILQDQRYYDFMQKQDKATFKVKATQSRQLLDDPRIMKAKDVAVYKSGSDDYYTYLVGASDSYEDIQLIKNKLSETGLMDLSILAYVNGIPLDKTEDKEYLSTYPNLKAYFDEK